MTKRADWIRFIVGSRGDDDLRGTAGRDVILGRDGADVLDGGAGNDILIGDGVHWSWNHCYWGKPSGSHDDYLDGGAGSDLVLAGRGNDVANYTLSENRGTHDVYDGGNGFDTLQLTLTHAEWQLASVQKDLAAFEAFLARRANPHSDSGKTFQFQSFDLDVRNFEALEIQLVGGNAAPVARNDSYSLDEDTVLLVAGPGVAGNDTDAEGSALSVTLVAGPAHGTLALGANGSFSYTPAANFSGDDSFTYQVNDGGLDSNVATVDLQVAAVNDAPAAADDAVATDEDVPVSGNVMDNAVDTDGDALTAALLGGPDHGTLEFAAGGSFTYTPAVNFSGTDSFTYQLSDGHAVSGVATVTLAVAPVNDAPVAQGDVIPGHTLAGDAIRVAVIGGSSGSYVAAAAQLEDSDAFLIDADALAATLLTTQTQWDELLENYDVVVLGDGGFQIDYNATMPLFPALRDFVDAGGGVVTTGAFAFVLPALSADADYIAPIAPQPFDVSLGGSSITILGTAHPITDGIASYQVNAVAHELAGGIDAGATVLASGVGVVSGSGVSLPALVVDAVGQGRTAYFGSLQMANADAYSPDRIAGGVVDQIFERVVAWAAGAKDVFAATDEDTPLAIDPATLLANDRDIENDALAIADVSETSARGSEVSITADGSILYVPTDALRYLLPGQVVIDSFDYTVYDGNGGTDIATVSLTVAGRADTDPLL
jgi:hypothetical protein